MPSLIFISVQCLPVFLFILLQMVFYALEAEVAAATRVERTTSYCRDRCGSVSIPYPFGMDNRNCYRDFRYKIRCEYSSGGPVPFLSPSPFYHDSKYWLQVLEIGVDYIRVNMVAPASCDYGKITTNSSEKYMTPFPVSTTLNKLVVIGCDIYGSVTLMNDELKNVSQARQTFYPNTACTSLCRGQNISIPSPCDGYGCCNTEIPKGLLTYAIQTYRVPNGEYGSSFPCIRAFLADQEFSGVDDLIWSKEDALVPVILDLIVPDFNTCTEAQRDVSYACRENSYCINSSNGPGYGCKCSEGYEGNPYLPHGCQDVDECKETNKCGKEVCTNTPGSYNCSCSPGKENGSFSNLEGFQCVLVKSTNSTLPPQPQAPPQPRAPFYLEKPAVIPKSNPIMTELLLKSGTGGALVGLFLLGLVYQLYIRFQNRKQMKLRQKNFARNGGLLLQQLIASNDHRVERVGKIFFTEEIEKATDYFNPSRIIGKGGFGTVYKGMLPNGELVAIKRSKLVDEDQVDQFINEVGILSQINQRNIVKLLGCCLESVVPLLVYEFVSNGTLSYHLHVNKESDNESLVSWKDRVRIAFEVAGALSYLHSDASLPIFHRDIKSANILLDEKYKAKVADFGISRSTTEDKTHLTTLVQGTFGYLDPEYFHYSVFTDKSDVYSFGVVLVELLTGEKVISQSRHEHEKGLNIYFINAMKQNRLFEILDARVLNEGDKDDILAVAKLAKRCLKYVGKKRPTMKEVSHTLGGLHEKLTRSSTGRSSSNSGMNEELLAHMVFLE